MDGYVYAVKCGPYVKIGVTLDIQTRLRMLAMPTDQTIKPADLPTKTEPMVVIGYLEGDRHTEKAFHEAFRPERAAESYGSTPEAVLAALVGIGFQDRTERVEP